MSQVGKYQLVRKLAVGGMAEVFLAKAAGPMGFEKTLVLKRILPHLASDPHFVEMFLSEAKLAAHLNHPNLVSIFDFGETAGTYYIAMEFIDGPNLRALYRRAAELATPLPFSLAAKVISYACEGLAYAHEFCDPNTGEPLGLIHRDISPDNLLLGRNGAVKVVDFGIAKAAGQAHHTKTGTLKGKLSYMPPEQLKGLELDRRADVFALGVVLYELVTGLKPFDATTEVAIMQAILYEPFIPARLRRVDVPPALAAILDKALAKDRDQRYPSCREFHTDLERFTASTGEPVGQFQLAGLVAQLAAAPVALGHTPLPGSPTTPPRSPSHPSLPAVAAPATPPPPPAGTSASLVLNVSEADIVPSAISVATDPATQPPGTAMTVPLKSGMADAPMQGAGFQQLGVTPAPQGPMTSFEAIEREADLVVPLVARRPSREMPVVEPPASRAPIYFGIVGVLLLLGAGGYLVLKDRPSAGGTPTKPVENPIAPVDVKPPEVKPPEVKPPEVKPPEVVKVEPPVEPPPKGDPPGHGKRPKPPPHGKDRPKPVIVAVTQPADPKTPPTVVQVPTVVPVPVPVPVAAPAALLASLDIETSPPLQIRVNGKFIGTSTATASGLPPGEVRVEVYDSKLGISKEQSFNLVAGSNGTRRIVVGQGSLEFRVRPFATVFLDGKPLGQTPIPALQVYEGRHSVKLVNKDLGKEVSTEYVVKAGQPNIFKYIFPE